MLKKTKPWQLYVGTKRGEGGEKKRNEIIETFQHISVLKHMTISPTSPDRVFLHSPGCLGTPFAAKAVLELRVYCLCLLSGGLKAYTTTARPLDYFLCLRQNKKKNQRNTTTKVTQYYSSNRLPKWKHELFEKIFKLIVWRKFSELKDNAYRQWNQKNNT